MFEYIMIRLLFILISVSSKSFAVQNEVCNKDQYVVSGSDLSFSCTNKGYITYAKVNINGRECMFTNTNYEITEDTKNCDESLRNRISLQQECSTHANCHSNSYTFRVTNVQIQEDSGVWTFSIGSGRSIRGSQQNEISVDIFESDANPRLYASKHKSTEGCPIPSDFQANASIVHYLMDSSWNGNAKKCFAYCYEDDSDTPHCMCKPSLMEDQNYTLLAGIFAAIFSVIGLILNILAILSLKEVAETDYPTLYVMSLSFSDLVSCVFTLPLQSGRFLFRDWVYGDTNGFMCKIFPILIYGQTALTLFNIAAITISRWICIFFPKRKVTRNRRNYFTKIIAIWVVPVLIMIPSLTGILGRHALECNSRICTILENENGHNWKTYLKLFAVAGPVLILLAADVSIFLRMRSIKKRFKIECDNRQQLNSVSKDPGERSTLQAGPDYSDMYKLLQKKEQEVIKMMVAIFIGFCLTYLPSFLTTMIDPHKFHPLCHILSYIILWASPIINPIIYIVTQKRYRTAFAKLLTNMGWLKEQNFE